MGKSLCQFATDFLASYSQVSLAMPPYDVDMAGKEGAGALSCVGLKTPRGFLPITCKKIVLKISSQVGLEVILKHCVLSVTWINN